MTDADRFWSKVDKSGDCWLWLPPPYRSGYGRFNYRGRNVMAHRVAWVLSGRELDPALVLDHLCRNRRCVNPDHLEQVTNRENLMRGRALVTHFKCGHPITSENLRWKVSRQNPIPFRTCLTCRHAADRRYDAKRPPRNHGLVAIAERSEAAEEVER